MGLIGNVLHASGVLEKCVPRPGISSLATILHASGVNTECAVQRDRLPGLRFDYHGVNPNENK